MNKTHNCLLGILLLLSFFQTPVYLYGQGLPKADLAFPNGEETVEIPFERYQEFIVVTVDFEGIRPLRMIVDTGAPLFVIADTALTNEMNLQIWAQAQVGGTGDGPAETAPLAGGVQARMGPLHISNAMLLVGVGGEAIAGLDGIVGGPLFENAVVELDWERSVLQIHKPESFSYDGSGTSLPLTLMPNRHVYTQGVVSVNEEEGRSITLHVDTGARQGIGLLAEATLPTPAQVVGNTVVAWGSRGPAQGDMGRVQRLQLGDLIIPGVVASFQDAPAEQGEAGWIGIPVLEQFHVIFDYVGERLILEPNAQYGDAFVFTTTGIVLKPWAVGSKVLTIVDVVADSPAMEADLEAGDRVIEVNGQSVEHLTGDAVTHQLLKPDPGTELTIKVRRNGKVITLKTTARRLL